MGISQNNCVHTIKDAAVHRGVELANINHVFEHVFFVRKFISSLLFGSSKFVKRFLRFDLFCVNGKVARQLLFLNIL